MKKLIVAVIIVGAFILYSFLWHSNAVALVPTNSRSSTSSNDGSSPNGTSGSGPYKDGSYTGSIADATWGNVQVKVVIESGKITSVAFLQHPADRMRSVTINTYADPQLCNEAIQAQSADVDIVTGATDTSEAFIQSLTDALAQAKV